jgi:hypothetical protein
MKQIVTLILSLFLSTLVYSQSVPSYVPTNGLVGWWGFNGNAQDGSVNGNHGTVNGATLTTDKFGNQNGAYSFDGIDDYCNLNSQLPNSFSISLWAEIDSFKVYNGISSELLSTFNQNFGSSGFVFRTDAIPNKIVSGFWNTNGNQIVSKDNIQQFQWNHYLVSYGSGILKLYFNGTLCDSIAGTYVQNNQNIFLAARQVYQGNNPAFFADCTLDDIGIWNRALTQQEITNLYNSQLPTQTSLCLPTITTNTPSSIGIDSVIVGGNITNDGGSSIVLRGVCYSTTPNPNMGNMRTEDGSGVGSFSTILRNLNPSTTYYVRSYAKNSNGVVVYGDEVSFSTSSITIGSIYAGGIVFYVDSTGQHGLVCAPSDQGNFPWGCNWQFIGGTLSLLNTGQSNTNLIISNCSENNIAALICNNYTLGQYDDWYLPSFDELMLIFWSLQGHSSFSQQFYWSSSEDGAGYAKCQFFAHGSAGSQSNMKNVSQKVRAIRSF